MSSIGLSHNLVDAVLGMAIVRRAQALNALLAEGSPFALVRAVELAELCLHLRAEGLELAGPPIQRARGSG